MINKTICVSEKLQTKLKLYSNRYDLSESSVIRIALFDFFKKNEVSNSE